MIKCILTVGGIACGKSTWAKEEVRKDPEGTARINRDDLRNMINGYVLSDTNEKFITKVRNDALIAALKSGRNVIMDETNLNRRNFDDVCKIVKSLNVDCIVMEKSFYVDLDVALERNSKREGTARIPDDVVEKFYKKAGGKQHQFYKSRVETFHKNGTGSERFVEPMVQNENLEKCAIFDLDGTMCNISHRNPYDASNCDKDSPNQHVVDLCKLLFDNGYKIFFFSGREDAYRDLTSTWLDVYFAQKYELYMRETDNKEDDRLLKERLFTTHVKDKYNCKLWVDDRLRVCKFIHDAGLPLFRVGDPEASF